MRRWTNTCLLCALRVCTHLFIVYARAVVYGLTLYFLSCSVSFLR